MLHREARGTDKTKAVISIAADRIRDPFREVNLAVPPDLNTERVKF